MNLDEAETKTPKKSLPSSQSHNSTFRTPLERLKQFARTPTSVASSYISAPDSERSVKTSKSSAKDKNEERYGWLENPLDKEGRPTTDPDYDPRTLHIPPAAWRKFTDFEKQFWEIKANHWDTVVFFKKGKFYGRSHFHSVFG